MAADSLQCCLELFIIRLKLRFARYPRLRTQSRESFSLDIFRQCQQTFFETSSNYLSTLIASINDSFQCKVNTHMQAEWTPTGGKLASIIELLIGLHSEPFSAEFY